VRRGKWKALKDLNDEKWQLYDVETDRCEMNDLADTHPAIVRELAEKWNAWANRCHVLPKRWVKKDAKGKNAR
jgi:arylsulfatase